MQQSNLTNYDRLKQKIETLEQASKYARSPQEAISIQYEINRLKDLPSEVEK